MKSGTKIGLIIALGIIVLGGVGFWLYKSKEPLPTNDVKADDGMERPDDTSPTPTSTFIPITKPIQPSFFNANLTALRLQAQQQQEIK